jgi:hypothetical protein
MDRLDGRDFVRLIGKINPSLIVDCRPFPGFDLRGLDRRAAFDTFARLGCDYQDLAGWLEASTRKDIRALLTLLQDILDDVRQKSPCERPVVMLVEGDEAFTTIRRELPLKHGDFAEPWTLLIHKVARNTEKRL